MFYLSAIHKIKITKNIYFFSGFIKSKIVKYFFFNILKICAKSKLAKSILKFRSSYIQH